jgi:UV DNA damage endonuclease
MFNLCCLTTESKMRTMTAKKFASMKRKEALQKLSDIWVSNLETTERLLQYCISKGWGYRLSSNIFPLFTHPDFNLMLTDIPDVELISDKRHRISKIIASGLIRVSMHPDQYCVLNSDNPKTVKATINELNMAGSIMDSFGCEYNHKCPINIHVSNSKDGVDEAAKRFRDNFKKLSASARQRLVIENEDKGVWNVDNLFKIHDLTGIPITLDNLHNKCNPSLTTDNTTLFNLCAMTWNTRPLFHYSEGIDDDKNKRKHADLPNSCPRTLYGEESNLCDWDIELKHKEKAIEQIERLTALNLLSEESQKLGLY